MGSAGAKAQRAARRAKIEEQRRAEAARERRNRIITVTLSGVIVAGLVGGLWYFIQDNQKKEDAKAAAAAEPVSGEKSWKDLGRDHVTTPVDYKMAPATGGNHHPTWMNCDGDVYAEEIGETNAVHSMEHGAVWVTYNDKAPEKDVSALKDRVEKTPYTLMSPYAAQSSPITLSAWGKQLNVKTADDPRVSQFLEKYVQGAQTPEQGAACTGGKPA
ncbi:DUF3105 domain-containing protein [Streptomyces sp. NPDC058001]|uniref:DUF3105 domain-containing protein n=1 Tax=Streptomyces sp. NPDC058001 TaxID=3346300 RepID=UPI0036F011FC